MNKKMISATALTWACLAWACQKSPMQDEPALTSANINITGQSNLTPKELLGKMIYFDASLSEPVGRQACASCHMPENGWTGLGSKAIGGATSGAIAGISEGAFAGRFGNRRPPSAAYATYSPVFKMIEDGEFKGGLFWDGRATGSRLGIPAAEQALGPFLSYAEQNHPTAADLLAKLNSPAYQDLWQQVWGSPISTANVEQTNLNYDRVGLSIAAYEASKEVNPFSSKYDAFLRGETDLTAEEKLGLAVFNKDGKCFRCHLSEGNTNNPPLFTDFEYYNIGIPKNTQNPYYNTNPSFIDLGLGGFLQGSTNPTWKSAARNNMGKFKTPTLRNIAKGSNKRFMHNGAFTSLEQVVDFYNTRDDSKSRGRWPKPEYADNLQKGWLGNLGLTKKEQAALVAFMKTLSDGYTSSSPSSPVN
jgi:cytochrome c peroxidase